jgi:hypothetical protein
MKISTIKFYSTIFAILLLLQLYVNSFKFNILLQIFSLFIYFLFEKQTVSLGFLKKIMPLFYLFLICFVGMFIHKYDSYNIIKDITHFIKPLFGIFIGYFFYKKINNFKLFVQTIVITSFISSIIHFGIIVSLKNIVNVSDIREYTRDNFVELFGLFFFMFYKKFQNEQLFRSRIVSNIIFISLLISCILYFSRTMIVMSLIIIFTVYGYTIITKKTIKIGLGLLGFVSLLYVFLFSVNIQRNRSGVESFLFKIKIAPAEIFKTHIDRDNHADLWDHWRGYEAERAFSLLQENPSGYLFGLGYGSLVNLKFYAPLSGDKKGMKFISELHNGYMYVLYKTGIIGLFLYLFFLFQLYVKIYSNKNFTSVFLSAIGLSIFISTLVIGSLFNGNPTVLFLLGGLLFFDEIKIKN